MIIPLIILMLATATQVDQALEAVGKGQAALEQKKYDEAAQALQGGLPAAAAIEDAETRQQALAAIHFFSALAYSGMEAESKAREQVELFLIQMPKSTSVDKAQYPAPFVATFGEVVKAIRAGAAKDFDKRYPGYRIFSTEEPKAVSIDLWPTSPEYHHLALPDEQARWKALTTQQEREAFVEQFWARRDPTPGTPENEFRSTFNARVAFADRTFGSALAERGSLTDRGRLLVLLGKPSQMLFDDLAAVGRSAPVGATAQEERDAGGSVSRAGVGRQSEAWGYDRDQLPVRVRDQSILFRMTNDTNQDFVLPPSVEYNRILVSVAEKAVRKK